jgi:hypothetical protein
MQKTIYEPDGSSIVVEYNPEDCAHPVEFCWEYQRAAYDGEPHCQTGWEEYTVCGLCGQEVNTREQAEVVEPEFDEIPF